MKKIFAFLLTALMCVGFTAAAMAADLTESGNGGSRPPYVIDGADLLTPADENSLNSALAEISERLEFTVAVVTTDSTGGKTTTAYTDDFYDYNGYGYGVSHDGAMLMISMENRDWYIATTGYGITALTDAGIQYIGEKLVPYLSDGAYYDAFQTFGGLCDDFVTQACKGNAYDAGRMPIDIGALIVDRLPISLVIGAIIAFITCAVMKSKLKSVKSQPAASSYVCQDSLKLDVCRDLFLYTNTTCRPRPKASSSGGGSSTHTSSSGTSHGGGGGKF